MKIYTSYFGNLSKLRKANIVPISIARYSPKWFNGPKMLFVAPTSYMLSNACSFEEYLKKYDDILLHTDPNMVIKNLKMFGNGRDVAMCCYEKPGDFCHRHVLAKWLSGRTGITIEEFGEVPPVEEKPKPKQLDLFGSDE